MQKWDKTKRVQFTGGMVTQRMLAYEETKLCETKNKRGQKHDGKEGTASAVKPPALHSQQSNILQKITGGALTAGQKRENG